MSLWYTGSMWKKKPGFDGEARQLQNELTSLLGIGSLTGLRLLKPL